MTNRTTSQPAAAHGYSEAPSLESVLDLLLDAVCLVDADGRFVFASAACERIFGYGPGELIGRQMQEMIHPEDLDRTMQAAGAVLNGLHLTHFENRYLRKDGQVVHVMWSARWSESDQLRIAVARDITERKQLEHRLQYAALYDQLTDLPNRVLFYDRLQNALALARRDQMRLSLLYLDLDSFKQVNDSHGHGVGDLLLQEVARRLRACVRASDTACRFGGDEFLVLLSGIDYPDDTLMVAEKIRASLSEPYDLGGLRLRTSASIGIAACPDHGDEDRILIHAADRAMYLAKQQGGNRTEQAISAAAP